MMKRRWADEKGSLPFTMLAVIGVGGMVGALFSITIATQQSVRDDRAFQTSIQSSDAGVQQALTQISELTSSATTTLSGTSTLGGSDFTWTANRNGNTWEVQSTGTSGAGGPNPVSRNIEATISRSGTFLVGAFADVAFTMRGSNGADSYNSATGSAGTGQGSIGSNGAITLNGNAFADQILLYGDAASCSGNGCSTGDIIGNDTRFDIDAIATDIQNQMDAVCTSGFVPYVASSFGTLQGGQTYCFSSMNVNQDVVLAAGPTGAASLNNPVTIYLSGNYDMSNGTRLNCSGCANATSTPDAGALQIYSTGSQIAIGNHTYIAGAIAAPNASCQGSPSNAQANIYGAMVCNDLSNQGGWGFHYDQSLESVDTGYWDIAEWREELDGQTSF